MKLLNMLTQTWKNKIWLFFQVLWFSGSFTFEPPKHKKSVGFKKICFDHVSLSRLTYVSLSTWWMDNQKKPDLVVLSQILVKKKLALKTQKPKNFFFNFHYQTLYPLEMFCPSIHWNSVIVRTLSWSTSFLLYLVLAYFEWNITEKLKKWTK